VALRAAFAGSLLVDRAPTVQPAQPAKPATWTIYKIAAKAVRLGTVEAPDEAILIQKAATEFKVPAKRLMASRRS
jgi:hypothetical protein